MSLAAVWTGNFQHLRKTLGCTRHVKLLYRYPKLKLKEVSDTKGLILRRFCTRAELGHDKSASINPCNMDLRISEKIVGSSTKSSKNEQNYEFARVQSSDMKQKIPENKQINRPATFIAIDIETTGFSRKSERIIEIALRDLVGGKNSTFQTLVKPHKFVQNSSIHGISSYMVNRPEVPRFDELVPILVQFVRSRQMDNKPVVFVAHNGRRFDIPFIISEFKRCSVEIPSNWLFLDTLPIARQLVKEDGSKLSSLTLQSLREHYGLCLASRAHRAMQDVDVLCSVLQRMTFDLKLTSIDLMQQVFSASELTNKSSRNSVKIC